MRLQPHNFETASAHLEGKAGHLRVHPPCVVVTKTVTEFGWCVLADALAAVAARARETVMQLYLRDGWEWGI